MEQELNDLVGRALTWADADCDVATAAECRQMAARGDLVELRDHFGGGLEFGTAGLRAKVGPGPWRMNRATVRRATRAVADQLLEQSARLAAVDAVKVVVAFDARSSSRELASEVCGTLMAAGVDLRVFSRPTPTPVAAFALRHESADAAIVVTASHNPKEYNGFKLYGADGAQIVGPTDGQIAARMAALGPARQIPSQSYVMSEDAVSEWADSVTDAYFRALAQLCPWRERQIRIAYTPLHGLGAPFAERALRAVGFSELAVVSEQSQPDPEFPTVPFPNPEEHAVMARVFALAETTGAHVALANDPDVDRLAVGIPNSEGKFVALSGNQVGVLLADFLLDRYRESGESAEPLVVQSVVSTPMLRSIAKAHTARYERTLTGFKWIARPAIQLEPEVRLVLGFEEAIGYCVLPAVRDKDGISAAVVFAELVDGLAQRGLGVADALVALYERHGLWVSTQSNVNLPGASGLARIRSAMQQLRATPCRQLGGIPVTRITDYAAGAESRPSWLPAADLIELELGDTGRLLVRPSGTEPKLKIYVDLRGQAPGGVPELEAAEHELLERACDLAACLKAELGLGSARGAAS